MKLYRSKYSFLHLLAAHKKTKHANIKPFISIGRWKYIDLIQATERKIKYAIVMYVMAHYQYNGGGNHVDLY